MKLEHGECVDVVRIERPGEEGTPIGWLFERERHYGDRETEDTYIQHAKVTVLASLDSERRKVIPPKHMEVTGRMIETYIPAKYMDVSEALAG